LKKIIILLFCFLPLIQFAQDFSGLWKGYFSYYNVKQVVRGNDKIYAASENAVFSVHIESNEIQEFTTINGLSGESISTIHYSETYELLIIGYENGLIEIAFDNDDDILTIVDIIDKSAIPPSNKKINHFNTLNNLIYISTNYGISVYDLERLEFGDTYQIGNGGTQVIVNQTAVFDGFIYAACFGGNGLKKADITSANLIDFNNWEVVRAGNFIGVENNTDQLYTTSTNRYIYEVSEDVLNPLFRYDDRPIEIQSTDGDLVVTTQNDVFAYNSDFGLISQVSLEDSFNTSYNSAIIVGESIYIGTKDFGVLKTITSNSSVFEEIRPAGPLRNDLFAIEYFNNNLLGVSGGYNLSYNFIGGDRRETGISRLINNEWLNIPFESIKNKIERPWYLAHVAINPLKPEQVFVSSYYKGLIEFNDDEVVQLFDETNSPLTPFSEDVNLTGTSTYDSDGVLWVANGRVEKPLNKYENGIWTSYALSGVIPSSGRDLGFSNITIDASGTKFIGSYSYGVIGFNESSGDPKIKNIQDESENMPTDFVTAVRIDKRNQLWIGTFRGLRVLYNTSNFFSDENIRVDDIIIEEDGIAKELLFQQHIIDIEIDGSNNKWIATSGAGLFYLSPDGQKTIYHFTKDNSPLPSNSISDVSLDVAKGVVYIATLKGMLSFNSGGSNALEDLSNAYAYPNPVRPRFNIIEEKVKIKDISENVNIKITDIEGNLVAEAQSGINQRYQGYNLEIDGGTAYWNGKNLANNIVASGVYLVMLSDLDTFETKVIKLMVVR